MTVQQIVNYPFLYALGCRLAYLTTTTISIGAGLVRSSTNMLDINIGNYLRETNPSVAADAVPINAATNGLNGLDTGSLANSTFYYVHVIADSTRFHPTGGLLSTSASAPLLPFGYDSFIRVGQVLTDGSAHILPFIQEGDYSERIYQYDAPINVVNALGSTSPATVALSAAVPLGARRAPVIFSASLTAATAANSFSLRPTGSTAFPVVVSAPVVSQLFSVAPFVMNTPGFTAASIDWKTSAAGDALTLNVVGYYDYI